MTIRLNDFTKQEILEAEATIRDHRNPICPVCEQRFKPAVRWQTFCSDICRHKYHREEAESSLIKLQNKIKQLEKDKVELLKEITVLKQQINCEHK